MYLKYLEDNLNHKFTKEMDEYKTYVKMFYNEKAKCISYNRKNLK